MKSCILIKTTDDSDLMIIDKLMALKALRSKSFTIFLNYFKITHDLNF